MFVIKNSDGYKEFLADTQTPLRVNFQKWEYACQPLYASCCPVTIILMIFRYIIQQTAFQKRFRQYIKPLRTAGMNQASSVLLVLGVRKFLLI